MRKLKKITILLSAFIFVGAFVACEKNDGKVQRKETASSSPLDSEPKAMQPQFSDQGGGISGTVDVSFPYVHQGGLASNQFAVWIENESGEFIKTLFVTQFTAAGGYKQRKEAVPTWVKRSKIEQGDAQGVDAVTGATPKSGNRRYTWDCKDENGNQVPAGNYKFFVEGTIRWETRVLYSGTIEIGSGEVLAEAEPEYSTDDAKESDMIGQVKAVYNP